MAPGALMKVVPRSLLTYVKYAPVDNIIVCAQMLPRTLRPSTTDMTAAVAWAATGGFGVIFLVQVSLP